MSKSINDYGTILGAGYLQSVAYSDLTQVKVGDMVTFLDARHLGIKKGSPRFHYRGEVTEINALSANPVKVRMQKFDPATGKKLEDSFIEESHPVGRWAPYDTVVRAFQMALAVAGIITSAEIE